MVILMLLEQNWVIVVTDIIAASDTFQYESTIMLRVAFLACDYLSKFVQGI